MTANSENTYNDEVIHAEVTFDEGATPGSDKNLDKDALQNYVTAAKKAAKTAVMAAEMADLSREATQDSADNASISATNAQDSADRAEQAANAAELSSSSAEDSATAAALSATQASAGASTATQAKDDAVTASGVATQQAANAKSSATAAKTSEDKAKLSEQNASASEANAASSASSAEAAKTLAEQYATAASTSAGNAASSESAAKSSADASAESAASASDSSAAAGVFADNASASALEAKNHADAAKESATRASGSATSAATSANAASTSAGQAAASAQSASSSAETASTKAGEASDSATAAESSKNAAATSASAAKKSETNAAKSASSASSSKDAAAASASAASTSETKAKASETAAASSASSAATSASTASTKASEAATSASNASNSANAASTSATNASKSATAAKTSETNAKASETKAQEYLTRIEDNINNDLLNQYNWPVVTGNESFYIKIAKLSDPGSNNCHVTLMVTNGGDYGSPYGNIDFIEISARGLPSSLTADNVSRYLSIRRLGSTGLANNSQMRYGLVKGDGFIEVWAFQSAFINDAKVAVLAQTTLSTELYIPDGFVKQTAAPSGYIEGNVVRIYDQVNKPTKADLGLSNAMLTGAFGLGGSGISTNGKMSDVEILKALRDKGGHFWRGDKPTGSTATIYSHGSGIFSRCGDTWSAINIDYSTAKIKIYAGNDAQLNNGTFSVNELYGSANKPSKSDVGLGNVTNDAQVKKSGDVMSGDLDILKETPSIRLKSAKGNAHLWFLNNDGSERGVVWSPENNESLGEIHIRAKNTKGESSGDFIVRHDGGVEASNLKITYKISGDTAEFANTSTNTLKIGGQQHTPLLLTRTGYAENLSIGFKVDNLDQKYLGINGSGDLAFGKNADHKQNSIVITQEKLDSGVTVGGQTTFSNLATFNAGIAGSIEPEKIDNQTIDLNNLVIKFSDKGSVKYYQCTSTGGGNTITNKPSEVGGNFLLRVESVRKVSDSDYTNVQTLVSADMGQIYIRYCRNGDWGAWIQDVVSGRNQDVSVKSLAAQKVTFGGVTLRGINKDEGSGIGVVFDGSNSTENTFGIVNTGGGSAVFHNYTKPADSSAVNTGVLIGGYGSRPWTGSTYTAHSNVSQHFLMDGVASATNHGGWFRLLTTPLNATVDERRQTFATSNNGDLYIGYDVPMGLYKLDSVSYNGLDILNGRGLKQINNTANEIILITPRNGDTAYVNFRGVAFDGTMTGTKGATQQGDNLWLSFSGHDGVKFTGVAAGIRIQASTGWSTTSTQCGITFATTAQGSTTRIDRWAITSDGTLSPAQDGTYAIGSSASRVTSIFATNGTIQTSDARLKTDVRKMSDAELSAAKDIAREFGFFQWIERVKTEGEAARWHAGITAQRVISIMESHGLDPMAYGIVCYDSWEEQEVVSVDPDSHSKTVTKIEAGDRYSLRYEELNIFIARGLEQRLSELEEKLL